MPPDIVDESSTSDVTVKEGDNVTLACKAKGKPVPRIAWRREDGERIAIHKSAVSHYHANNNKWNLISPTANSTTSTSTALQTMGETADDQRNKKSGKGNEKLGRDDFKGFTTKQIPRTL